MLMCAKHTERLHKNTLWIFYFQCICKYSALTCVSNFLYSMSGSMFITVLTLQLGYSGRECVATEYVVTCESKGAQIAPMTITND